MQTCTVPGTAHSQPHMPMHRSLRTRSLLAGTAAGLTLSACAGGPRIVDRPISFSEERVELTRDYIRDHYGISATDLEITPRIIVLHWTAIDDLESSFRAFDREIMPGSRALLSGAGQVNVSIQFLVSRDGTIYRLMPENWMARHVIGLNYGAIGVENVGGAGGEDNLTDAQVEANVRLVRYLAKRYPTIEYLVGHSEYLEFEGHPLWQEQDPNYRTSKIDPGDRFMSAVRARVSGLELKGPGEIRDEVLKPAIIAHSAWEAEPPVGHPADAARRNLAPGDTLRFGELRITLLEMAAHEEGMAAHDEGGERPRDRAVLEMEHAGERAEKVAEEGEAFNWNGFHFAVLAVHTRPNELGAGLTELEVATVESLPAEIAESTTAGDATYRLRVPHEIRMITLHHSGSAEPLRAEDDPVEKLRGLQAWGRADKNWWDVPYHFLIDLEGTIYQGRDYRYMGETNTSYDPRGHLLISVLGNYNRQEPTPSQVEAITELMAWAAVEFDVPVDRIHGHGDLAETSCPGTHLRSYLDEGTFRRGVERRLEAHVPGTQF